TCVAAALAAVIGVPRGTCAQDIATSGRLALDDVVAYARAHSPALEAARRRASAAEAVPARAAAYDDPTFSYEAWNAPESLRLDRADNNILSPSQKLPFRGKRRLAGQMARGDADVAREEAESAELDLVAEVNRAYFDLWRRQQNLLVYARDRELVDRVARLA